MMELRMIIPAEPPRGNQETLEFKFLAAFGGYTVTKGNGAWMPGGPGRAGESPVVYESVLIYDVAADLGSGLRGYARLRRIARWAAGEFGQTSIYLRGPGGEVEFVTAPDPLSDPNSFKGPGPSLVGQSLSDAKGLSEFKGEGRAPDVGHAFGPDPDKGPGGWHKHPKLTVPTRSEAAERAEAEAEDGPTDTIDALADARAAKDARERAGFEGPTPGWFSGKWRPR